MIEFLNPVLFGGLFAISAPVIIHLLHRRKIQRVDWGAMRFLLEMLAKRRRRLFLDELLLLLVRALVIACLALAMLRPAVHRQGGIGGGTALSRQGRVAAVLLVDDSVSSMAGRAQPAFDAMKKLGAAYLDSLAPGDEVSVLLMSQLGAPPSDPVFDLEGIKSYLLALKPSYVATDMPALLDAGLNQFKRHINPGAELVVLTDGRKDGWHEEDRARWDDLRERLSGPKRSTVGTRPRPQVIVLSPTAAGLGENLAITSVGMDRTLVSAGKPAGIQVNVSSFGIQGSSEATVQVSVNGEGVGAKRIEVPAGGQQAVNFTCAFPESGSYAVEASLLNHQDVLSADDRRAVSIQVEPSLPVLLVDASASPGVENKLGFLHNALEPQSGQPGAFKVTRIPSAQFTAPMLEDYRVVVLGDARVLEPSMVAALERFVVQGGGVLVGLGPETDRELVNRYWARDGEGFLPCPLAAAVTPERTPVPAAVNFGHPVFSGFGANNDEAWKAAKVRSYFKLEVRTLKAADLDVLLTMDNEDPLVVERRRGLGLVTLVTTSLNADWTDLPLQPAFVPLMRGIVGRLGSFIIPPRNLQPGGRIIYARVKNASKDMRAEDPSGRPLNLTLGAWEGRDAVVSEPLMEPGVYVLHDPSQPKPIHFAVAVSANESALAPIDDGSMSRNFEGALSVFHSPEDAASSLDPARRLSVELWKWFLAAAAGLMFVEASLTRRDPGVGNGRGGL
jgi:Mg-chelatase subunit ChlD